MSIADELSTAEQTDTRRLRICRCKRGDAQGDGERQLALFALCFTPWK